MCNSLLSYNDPPPSLKENAPFADSQLPENMTRFLLVCIEADNKSEIILDDSSDYKNISSSGIQLL